MSGVTTPGSPPLANGAPRSPEDAAYLERFDSVMRLPLVLSALLPIVIVPESGGWLAAGVGVVTWLVFLVDYVVHARHKHRFGHTGFGRFDLVVVILTAPWFLLPGFQAGRFVVLLRLARLARLMIAGKGTRRLLQRLGRVLAVAVGVVVIGGLVAYRAEHAVNPEFATRGDAMWWGIVTLTTVGYGDITPITPTGRWAGVAIMITGVAVLGVLAGSLASFFRLQQPGDGGSDTAVDSAAPSSDATWSDAPTPAPALIGEELGRLADLRDRGVLSDEELEAEKSRLLAR
jgi:voltage-gated potassium channel